jgi:hypothetical protein
MERIEIKTGKQEVKYKGLYFSFLQLRKHILKTVPKGDLEKYVIHRKFNTKTGEIEYKHAWESVIIDMREEGSLVIMLDDIIKREYLD